MPVPNQAGATTPVGSADEIAIAIHELRDYGRRLGRELRAATAEARAVNPFETFRPRSRRGRDVKTAVYRALSPDDRAIVDRAERLRLNRQHVGQAADHLAEPTGPRIVDYVAGGIDLEAMEATGDCPVFRRLVDRWQEQGGILATSPLDRQRAELLAQMDRLMQQVDKLRAGRRD